MAKVDLSSLVVTRVVAVNKILYPARTSIYRKDRELWAVSVKVGGVSNYKSGGKSYRSDPDNIVVLPKGSSYTFDIVELGECYMIEFEVLGEHEGAEITSYPIKRKLDFLNSVINAERLWCFKKPAYDLACISVLYGILAKLKERELSAYISSEKYNLIAPALRYLEENYSDTDISNDKLAEISGISSVYFRKTFFSVFNLSPMRYVRMIRIEKAKDMLCGDYSSISTVSSDVGFESVYHFSKTFKKVTGYSPSEYAKIKRG